MLYEVCTSSLVSGALWSRRSCSTSLAIPQVSCFARWLAIAFVSTTVLSTSWLLLLESLVVERVMLNIIFERVRCRSKEVSLGCMY